MRFAASAHETFKGGRITAASLQASLRLPNLAHTFSGSTVQPLVLKAMAAAGEREGGFHSTSMHSDVRSPMVAVRLSCADSVAARGDSSGGKGQAQPSG